MPSQPAEMSKPSVSLIVSAAAVSARVATDDAVSAWTTVLQREATQLLDVAPGITIGEPKARQSLVVIAEATSRSKDRATVTASKALVRDPPA